MKERIIRKASMNDLDRVAELEALCFPAAEAASRESFEARLRVYPECFWLLMEGDRLLAFAMGSRLSADTMDIHFEKAREDVDGAYAVINCEFARYLRQKYPWLQYLNREEDMGIEGLRKAKLAYCPDHMVEKWWACLLEDGCDY